MLKLLLLTLVMPPTGCAVLVLCGLLLRLCWRRPQGRPRRVLGRRGGPRGGPNGSPWGNLVGGVGTALAWIGVITLLVLSLPAVSDNLLLALEQGLPTRPPADHAPQAIIVLGGEVFRSKTLPLGVGPGPLTLERLRTAAGLGRRTGLPILVTGGVTEPRATAVGTVMAESLREDFREPARWVEDKSRDTWENARLSAAILVPQGITSVYVVTSAWHMRRALLAFRDTGLTATAAPTPAGDPIGLTLYGCLPQPGAWLNAYYALHEWIGYAWYRLR